MKDVKNYFLVTLFAATAFLLHRYHIQQLELVALKQNERYLLSDIERYQTKQDENVASVQSLMLRINQLDEDTKQQLKNLNVNVKRVKSIGQSQTSTKYTLDVPIKDSVRVTLRDSFTVFSDTLRCIDYADKWLEVSGCVGSDKSFSGIIKSRDSLMYVEHVVPKKFLFFKWGVKERRQEIVSYNPNTTIIGTKFTSIRN